jgi:hypothetical protein
MTDWTEARLAKSIWDQQERTAREVLAHELGLMPTECDAVKQGWIDAIPDGRLSERWGRIKFAASLLYWLHELEQAPRRRLSPSELAAVQNVAAYQIGRCSMGLRGPDVLQHSRSLAGQQAGSQSGSARREAAAEWKDDAQRLAKIYIDAGRASRDIAGLVAKRVQPTRTERTIRDFLKKEGLLHRK